MTYLYTEKMSGRCVLFRISLFLNNISFLDKSEQKNDLVPKQYHGDMIISRLHDTLDIRGILRKVSVDVKNT